MSISFNQRYGAIAVGTWGTVARHVIRAGRASFDTEHLASRQPSWLVAPRVRVGVVC